MCSFSEDDLSPQGTEKQYAISIMKPIYVI